MPLNIFEDDAFSLTSLTAAVNDQPVVPSQIHNSGLFEEEGIDTTSLIVEKQAGSSALVAYTERGAAGETIARDNRNVRSFVVPHLQRDDAIMADEVQNVRAFGEMNVKETVTSKVNKVLARHLRDFDMTIEHQRAGAMKGVVLDKNGNTIENLYTAFEVAVPSDIPLELDNSGTDVQALCQGVGHEIEDAIEGQIFTGLWALCGREFWQALINHPYVKDAYKAAQDAAALLGKEPSKFTLGPITFERYKISPTAVAAAAGGGGFVEADEAMVVPLGVPDMFITRFAPADYSETVNTIGLARYAKMWPRPDDKGYNLQVQSNPISLCTRPGALRTLTLT